MSEILVVGSLAYDSIQTPFGKAERALGGSANYFSLAASLFSPVRVVGVVGEDYSEDDMSLLKKRKVNIEGMSRVPGKTFHWEGFYEGDMNEAKTLKTELNVFEHFNPKLPKSYCDSKFVFLANIAPELQLEVLSQVKKPLFVGMDTMNFWISSKIDVLKKVISKVNLILINEHEAEMLTGAANAIAAAPMIIKMGVDAVVIKRGEYGFVLFTKSGGYFMLPAMPISEVIDPTGAGDTFAGGFFGYLASLKKTPKLSDLKKACMKGVVSASFTIQDFGVNKIAKVNKKSFNDRFKLYLKSVSH